MLRVLYYTHCQGTALQEKIKFFSSISESAVTYITITITKISIYIIKQYYGIIKLRPFKPILSAIGTPNSKFAKFLVPKISSITFNEFTAKDSFAFAEEILYHDRKRFMGNLDVESFVTNKNY